MPGIAFLKSLWKRREGGVAVQFALLALPLTVLAFGTYDINHADSRKRQVQDALDAATLMAARSYAVTDTDLQKVGSEALTAQLATMTDASLVSSSFNSVSPNIVGTAKVNVTPVIANLWKSGDMTVNVSSTVVRSLNKLEVVMVLDNTGSMASSSKLTNLKTAAKGLIDTLSSAAARSTDPNAVKIGIVPFSTTVRLSDNATTLNTYKSAAWMDSSGSSSIAKTLFTGTSLVNRFTLFNALGKSWAGCVEGRPSPYDVLDTAPTTSTPDTLIVPYFWPDEPDAKAKKKNGDFGDFDNNYTKDLVYSSTNWKVPQGNPLKYVTALASGVDGPNKGCDMEPISRLSQNWTALKSSVDDMVAVGETHIPIGLAWGWSVLSPNAPFADGVAYNTPNTTKIVILMTDGDNTWAYQDNDNESDYDGYGYIWQNRLGTTSDSESDRTAAMDSKMQTLCTNMKAKGIVIYSVGVMVSNSSKNLLSQCATSTSQYYDVTSSGAITTAFSAIAGAIDKLRIAK